VSRQAVIVDTNVVIGGLLTGNATSPVARILDGILAAVFPFVVSEALLAEWRTVLVRPGLRKQHGMTVTEVETLLTDIAQHAIVMTPGGGSAAPDRTARAPGPLAERCFAEDPNTCLLKLRQLAGLLAQLAASNVGLLRHAGRETGRSAAAPARAGRHVAQLAQVFPIAEKSHR